MPNFNSVQLIGHVTRDPELRTTQGGQNLAKFGIAVTKTYYKDDVKQEKTCFVDCAAWGKAADNIGKYVKKGDPLFVQGELELEQWEDKNGGGKRSKHSINVREFQLLKPKDPVAETRKPFAGPPEASANSDYGHIPF